VRLASLRQDDALLPAFVIDDAVYPIVVTASAHQGNAGLTGGGAATLLNQPQLLPSLYGTLREAVARGAVSALPLAMLGPPIPRPGKIICVGRNYAEHARETGSDVPTRPILFSKFATAVIGPFDDVVRPREVADLDYEGELCVVIGTRARHVTKSEALQCVAGYCCANDVSARTAQLGMGDQWLRGKSFDTFCPIGPVIVTRDEIADPQQLRIVTRVDGDIRQDASTSGMTFDVATLVSYCSDAFTLEPGDLILTGTPPGVALGRTPPPWLQPGQQCEVEIDAIGRIANRIVDE
jgi:2-keto-4-pentenoate hydratase/2-oxohepta-3-ene-1,7-dioic acid hydratase in catechol pathway